MTAPVFYVGLHHPSDAHRFPRACISIRVLWGRRKPLKCPDVMIDSGAFSELSLHGRYRTSVEDYARELCRLYKSGVANITVAVTQDYMCESFMLARTGLTISEHQRLTIERYDLLVVELNRLFDGACPFHIMPVIQGYTWDDYTRHLRAYGDRIKPGMQVGIGSVCKRNGSPERVVDIIAPLNEARPDVRWHGFGLKLTALRHPGIRELLYSADSMAWSYAARREGRNGNCWTEAAAYARAAEEAACCSVNVWQPSLPLWRTCHD